ncbi:MAG: BBP7 family outer membrane beta-barrel protein, partial [Gemmataceae bacterium]
MRTHLLVALTLLSGAVLARAQQVPVPGTLPPGTGLPPGISSLPSTLPGASPGGMGIPTTGTLVGSPILSGDGSIAGPITEGVPVSGGGARQGAQRFWLAGRYRLGWMAKQNLPYPLLTTGPTTDPAPGSLRQPGTQIVYGNEIDYSVFKGFEVEAGYFLDDEGRYSVDASGFVLFQNTDTFQATSDSTGAPLLARPVYNVLNHQEGAYLNSYPTAIVGSSQIVSKANLWGFETNSRYHFAWSPRLHGNGLVGFRYMNLAESLRISDQLAPLRTNTLTFLGDFVNAPDSLADVDSFVTRNQFYGGQLGGQVTWEDTWFFLTLNAKIAL